MTELETLFDYIQRITHELIGELRQLSDEQINTALPIPDTNTVYAIATHYIGMAEFWTLTLVGGRPSQRVRSEEFIARGSRDALIERMGRYLAAAGQLLLTLPAARLDQIATVPAEFAQTGGFKDKTFTCRDCLFHVLEHSATHLGHIQLTKDLLKSGLLQR